MFVIFNIFFYVIERGHGKWSGGAGAWRPEGVRDLSAVTVLYDHKQWLCTLRALHAPGRLEEALSH
jgi:hypothetical protein